MLFSLAAINAGPLSPVSVTNSFFSFLFFFRNPFRTQTPKAKQQDRISLLYSPTLTEWFYHIIANLNSAVQIILCMQIWRQCYHRNEVCLGMGWAEAGCLSSEQTQVVQQEIHRFRESRRSISLVFCHLALTLLPRSRHFQMQEANRKLAAGRFVLYPESQVVQTSLIPFIWKQNYLHTLQLALSLCLPSLFSFRETVNDSLPVQKTDFHGKTNLAFCLLHCLGPLEWDCWKCSTACFHRFYPVP